jgi:hypothetical protein
MKQRRTSYLIATDQRMPNRGAYVPSDFIRTNKDENYPYDIHHEQQQQKLRFDVLFLNGILIIYLIVERHLIIKHKQLKN